MEFQIYNTLTRQKEIFTPLHPGKVNFYSCGPTVYNTVHIGNLRAFLAADTLRRWLQYGCKYEVTWVMNITDVEDKTIRGAREEQKAAPELSALEALQRFTRRYEALFFADLAAMNIPRDAFAANPRATESIPAMQDLIRRIAANGYAYVQDGSIYFSIERYIQKEHYGKLLKLDLSALKTGTRTLADEVEKENIEDFVLWKGQKPHEPSWDFDFNGQNLPGRPGWHIECSAMEYSAFGALPFDLHSGGIDLQFPHHEDEIAQSVAGYGIEPTRYFMHNEHLLVDGKKMSKSLGNFYTLSDLMAKGYSPETIRFFLVSNHYRTKLNLTTMALEAAAQTLQNIRNTLFIRRQDRHHENRPELRFHLEKFSAALHDDLNTPQALAIFMELIEVPGSDASELEEVIQFAEAIFGVRFRPLAIAIPSEIQALAAERQAAKNQQDFANADRLRAEIEAQGYRVRDSATGSEILPRQL